MALIPTDLTNLDPTEGEHIARIVAYEEKPAPSEDKSPYILWELELVDDDNKKMWYMTTLSPKARFVIRDFCIAAGIPFSAAGWDPDDGRGKELRVTVAMVENDRGRQAQITKIAKA